MNRALVIPPAVASVPCSLGTAARTTGARPFRGRIWVSPGIPGRSRVGQPRPAPGTGPDTDCSQQWDLKNHWPFEKICANCTRVYEF